ncbi:MAG: NAD(P)-dependent alcohol dehydrogenase [Propionibacteriaceae bacterium]|jgi:uncharacterized zinc-type alcohol dehydrogenase-like protein|nr:NAD(P)-dependent alcohol dehydrogenase [Propionibacteriaceae bacterium]
MSTARAWAMDGPEEPFHPTTITRREVGPTEVAFDIKYAGICHSDIHTARSGWGPAKYPIVPGHEIAGVVREVGTDVTKFAVGDRVGVGCLVDACGTCEQCRCGREQFCKRAVWTYNSIGVDGEVTKGGYSTSITVEQDFVCRIPDALGLDVAAPLLCAGITTYSPLKKWGAGPGKRVAIVGMGGLGHVAVQIAAAMGAEVSVISQTRSKEADGRRFGASNYIAVSEDGWIKGHVGEFDLVLSTVAADEDITQLVRTVAFGGAFIDVGMPETASKLNLRTLCSTGASVNASLIGGIAETQEMLDFCAEHGVAAQVEVIPASEITAAYDRVVKSAVRYRYVIDASTI